MYFIDEVLVREEIVNTCFHCDLDACKGACCTLESEFGAPLLEEEISEIQNVLDVVYPYLPDEHIKEIKKRGFFERKQGDLMVNSVNNRACVFVYFDNGIAKCAIEKAYFEGKVEFRKPISCHLFPIRISRLGGDVVRYEEFSDCAPALQLGNEKKINILNFCKESLTRKYGKKWYQKLKEVTGK